MRFGFDIGHLSGAVLDVFVPEPIPPGHRLWTTKNLIISPHTAADDPATYNPISLDLFLENLTRVAGRATGAKPVRYDARILVSQCFRHDRHPPAVVHDREKRFRRSVMVGRRKRVGRAEDVLEVLEALHRRDQAVES